MNGFADINLVKAVYFQDEDELRRRLDGVLAAIQIEKTIEYLQQSESSIVDFLSVELTEEKAELLGWTF